MNISAKKRDHGVLCSRLNNNNVTKPSIAIQFMRISFIYILLTAATLNMLMAFDLKAQDMNTQTIHLELHQENLLSAIRKIEKQSSLRFFFRSSDIEAITTLNLGSGTRAIRQTLTELLTGTDLTFRQVDQTILIEKKSPQQKNQIGGKITGTDRLPIPYATVVLRKASEPGILKTISTDNLGNYKFSLPENGAYLLDISAIGTQKKTVSITVTNQDDTLLEDIILSDQAGNLKEVTVVGKKAFIEQKLDKTVVNVGSLISNNGANALEVLEKSPGVVIDGNGNISFKGKPGVTIFMDGKPTYLSGSNLANYLKSIPASLLEQIELMDNPPAKFDAAGDAGMINITTKKTKTAGFNGAVAANYSQAHYGQTSESINLNYRINKINLFSSASYALKQDFRQFGETREYFDNQGLLRNIFEVNAHMKPVNNSGNLKIGMDYYRSPKTTWGIIFTGALSPRKENFTGETQLLNQNRRLDSIIYANNTGKAHFNNGGVNLNYSHQFDSLGRSITFDLDGLTYSASNKQRFFNQSFDAAGNQGHAQIITDDLPTSIQIYSAKTDYTRPLKGKGRIEAGLKTSYIETDNQANYFNEINAESITDPNFTNHFLYKENINAGYLNFNTSFRRFALQTGLRVENTNSKGHQLGNEVRPDSSFTKSYTNLFPTAYLSYKLDSAGRHLLILSFGRRIRRPFYQDLNPFVTIIDKYSYFSGNPFLKPQFSNTLKASYSYKSILTASLHYMKTKDLQNEVIRQEGDIFIDGVGNIGTAKYLGASLTLSLSPYPWWMTNTYMQVFNTSFKGKLFETYLDESRTMGEINMTNIFTLPKGWGMELSGFYVSKRSVAQFINNGTGQLNAGIQKKVMENKGTVSLNVRDILRTYNNNGITTNIPNATEAFRNRYNSQSFTLAFNYSFGGSKNKKSKRETGSADIEKARIKQ